MKAVDKLSLRSMALLAAAVSMLLLFAYFAVVYYKGVKAKHVATVQLATDAVSTMQMIAQLAEAWVLVNTTDSIPTNSIENFERLAAQYTTLLSVLMQGGEYRFAHGQESVNILLPEAAQVQWQAIHKQWQELRPALSWLTQSLMGDAGAPQQTYDKQWLVVQLQSFARKHMGLLSTYEEWVSKQEQEQYVWFGILLGLTFVLFFALFMVAHHLLLQPIRQLAHLALQLAKGQPGSKVEYPYGNEMGLLVNNVNQLSETLFYASEFAREIGQGNLDAQYRGKKESMSATENNLVATLESMRLRLKEVAQRDQEERWIAAGIAHFANVLRGAAELDLDSLSYLIISNLVQYMELQQGAIYLVEEQMLQTVLRLQAAYAMSKRRYLNKELLPGEGLVGQAYRDKQLIYVEDVPPGFDKISSALGASHARSVVVAVLKMNEEVQGVVELMSLHPIPAYKRELLARISENLASVIMSAKNNERLRRIQQEAEEIEKRLKRRGL